MTSLEHAYVSSSLVKEIAQFGGDVSAMVPGRARAGLRDARAATGKPGRRDACHNPGETPPGREPTGGRPLDIIFLVERLESLIANGKPLPLTRNAIIDRDAALNLIDELRVAVPEEVRAAKRINQEGERIIEKAQEEAERIVGRAQEQAAYLIEERGLTEAAEDESRRISAGPTRRRRRARRRRRVRHGRARRPRVRGGPDAARASSGGSRCSTSVARRTSSERPGGRAAAGDDDGYEAEAVPRGPGRGRGSLAVSRR